MTKKQRALKILAWLLAAFAILGGSIYLGYSLTAEPIPGPGEIIQEVALAFILPILYAGLGALIVSRQPGNMVGWLMLISTLEVGGFLQLLVGSLASAPPVLTPGIWLVLWFTSWSWIVFIFPIFLIPLYFPDGRLPSPRWIWVIRLAAGLGLFLIFGSIFGESIGPPEGNWTVPNPIGFIPDSFFGPTFLIFWGIGLMTVVAGSVASLIVRYRRSRQNERDQIKWLLFAGVAFFFGYGISYILSDSSSDSSWGGPIFLITLVVFPVAIGIAILRHRLYNIDLIIRRTLQYSLLTGLLALMYFGGVVVFQGVFGGLTGETGSPLVTVLTTLLIAALFNPLRRRTQEWIDRRFYRKKYDAERALARFAAAARDEVDIDRLMEAVFGVVADTMQPVRVSSWIKEVEK